MQQEPCDCMVERQFLLVQLFVDFETASAIGAGFQAFLSWVGEVAVNKILPFMTICVWRTK